MATTLSIVAVFVPVAFMKGIVGKFFFEFGITVTVAVLISLFVSLTLTPMMTSRFLSYRKKHGKVYMFLEKGFDTIFDLYNPLLALALRNRWKVIALAGASVVVGLAFFAILGKEFMPAEDQGRYMVRLETPIDYSLAPRRQRHEKGRRRTSEEAGGSEHVLCYRLGPDAGCQ